MLLLDLALAVLMITLTGDWASPLILTPLPTVILAAYGWGYREGLAAAALTGATIALADALSGVSEDALRTGILASVVVLLAALVGGFTRQLWLEAERRQQETLDQVTRMSIANDLLHALHDVVQTLPSSLDLSDVVTSAQQTFRELRRLDRRGRARARRHVRRLARRARRGRPPARDACGPTSCPRR